jgi:4-diphosphocytidyl-2-C-methyl-D-erythritol kinase
MSYVKAEGRLAGAQRTVSSQLDAPAKVNLGLRVVGRRADGYHELESLFVPLDLADAIALRVEPRARRRWSLAVDGPPRARRPATTTSPRARRARSSRGGHRARRDPPHQAHAGRGGLGGGSSDAAAVLRGLAEAFPGALKRDALEEIALALGADVPFFLDPQPAWVTGIGERRAPVAGVPALALLLANPGAALATREVFRAFDALARPRARVRPAARPRARARRRTARSRPASTTTSRSPRCGCVRRSRGCARSSRRGRSRGRMSGSGATVFGVSPTAPPPSAPRRVSSARPRLDPGRGDRRIPISSAALGDEPVP